MKQLFILLFCFLLAIPAHADVAYSPPTNNFYEENRQYCTVVERNYYSNGEKGYITLRSTPDGLKTRHLTNGVMLHLYCTYGSWAMITHENGVELDTPEWTELNGLYLIYDGESFMEEFQAEIQYAGGKLLLPEGAKEIYYYEYPGAADPKQYSYFDETLDDVFSRTYTDSEGRRWGYIPYYRGIKRQWVCLDDPIRAIPPFGGDPYLAQFHAESAEEESPIIPAKTPPTFVFNPLPWLAVGLVTLTIGAAVILLMICYKRKGK